MDTNDKKTKTTDKEEDKPIVAKTPVDIQRLKLMKLMKNPEKPVIIPERPKAKNTPVVPEFVRNVMGSSAGAGSGEFHVYRHLRRKEYARQKFIQEKGKKELMDLEYQQKLEDNKKKAEEVTAKKRAKRLKKKQKMKNKPKRSRTQENESQVTESDNEDEEDEDEDEEEEKKKEKEKKDEDSTNENKNNEVDENNSSENLESAISVTNTNEKDDNILNNDNQSEQN